MSGPLGVDRLSGGVPKGEPKPLPAWLYPVLVMAVAGGAVTFSALLAGPEPARAWQSFLVNFLFWSGVAVAGVVLAAIFEVSEARWPVPTRQLGEACAAFLPVSFLLFLATWFGRRTLLPWADHPPAANAAWLNVPFFFAREALGLLLLYGAALLFSYRSLRAENRLSQDLGATRASLRRLAVVVLVLYASVYTIFAWDFVMSLDPAWSSTLFGGYYFVGNLYLGLAAVTALTVFTSRRHGLDHSVDSKVFHNLGKLLFCFALLWTYLFWSQYLVIWYGNLPRETRFLLVRTAQEPWSTLALAVLLANFLIPFVILLFRAARKSRQALLAVSAVIVAGMWLERFLLVAPSLSPRQRLFLGWQELAITAGFFALFLLTYMIALRGVSLLARRTSGDSQ